ncbi:MAG TPA: hypothetical protein VIK14_15175, partial [Ignavibacteria bacterium]
MKASFLLKTYEKYNNKQLFWFLYSLALIVKTIFLLITINGYNVPGSDHQYYFNLGKEYLTYGLMNPFSILMPESGLVMVGPVEPLYVGLITFFFGDSWTPVFLSNLIISSFIPGLIFIIGEILNYRGIGFYAGLYSVFYKFFIGNAFFMSAGKDMLMTLLFTLSILITLEIVIRNKKWTIGLALLYSIMIHLDERFLLLLPVFFFCLFLRNLKFKISNYSRPFLFCGFVFLLSLPWFVRNYIVHEKVILLTPRLSGYIDPLLGQKTEIDILKGEMAAKTLTPSELDSISRGLKTTKEYYFAGRPKETMEIPVGAIKKIKQGELPYRFNTFELLMHSFRDFFWPINLSDRWSNLGFTYIPKQKKFSIITNLIFYGSLLPFFMFFILKLKKTDTPVFLILGLFITYSLTNIL